MNPMYEFNDREIALLDMALHAIAETTHMAIQQGATPPDGLVEALNTTIEKLNLVIQKRCDDFNLFGEIVKDSLSDVEAISDKIVSNPDLPINEYN